QMSEVVPIQAQVPHASPDDPQHTWVKGLGVLLWFFPDLLSSGRTGLYPSPCDCYCSLHMSQTHIKRFINDTWMDRYGFPLPQETIVLLWSSIVSVYGLGGLLGSVCCGYLTAKYRKKKCQMLTNGIMLTAALSMGFSKRARSFEMIFLGRLLYGIGIGFAFNIHPQYVGEISPKKLRGFTNATVAVFLTLGKVAGQIIGLGELLGNESSWPLLLAFSALTAVVQLVMLPCFPDSPSYLLIQKGNEEAFLKAIKQLWGEGDHQAEIEDLKKEKAAMPSTKHLRVLEVIQAQSLRWQLYVMITVMTTLQLCGINAVESCLSMVVAAEKAMHRLSSSSLHLLAFQSSIIEHFGRRLLLWGGYASMVLVLALLTVTLSLQVSQSFGPGCGIVCNLLCIYFSLPSPAGATISVMVEIFNQNFRPSAFVIVGIINWMGLFLLGMIFPFTVEYLGPFCFLIFMGILAASGVFIYLFLPETKGKSIVEITMEFNKLNYGKTHPEYLFKPLLQMCCGKLTGHPNAGFPFVL
uniref:Solute carrier family 2, facilitated glucose transporter member 5 n=1 Tax=Varanus komodoensis TaxID=61221 RepID=A0A8D2JDZ1_VARKO